MPRSKRICFFPVILLLVLSGSLFAQNTKRLILKDGSYQQTTQWEIKGDRVRFYSAERYDWEEIPTMLIDWAATQKFNSDLESGGVGPEPKLHKDYDKEKQDLPEKPETPPVAPGLELPEYGGVFLFDTWKNQPQLVELAQNGGDLNQHRTRNILRAAINPMALSSKQTIELEGAHASVQAHVAQPVIYVQVESGEAAADKQQAPAAEAKQTDQALSAGDRYRIVRLQSKKDSRVVGDLTVSLTGKMTQKESWIKTNSAQFGEWTKITPAEPLPRGEYALVEMLNEREINLDVWDFGVDSSAPENANTRTGK